MNLNWRAMKWGSIFLVILSIVTILIPGGFGLPLLTEDIFGFKWSWIVSAGLGFVIFAISEWRV